MNVSRNVSSVETKKKTKMEHSKHKDKKGNIRNTSRVEVSCLVEDFIPEKFTGRETRLPFPNRGSAEGTFHSNSPRGGIPEISPVQRESIPKLFTVAVNRYGPP